MSIKHFHIFFISICVLLSLVVGWWGVTAYRAGAETGKLTMGLLFFAVAAGLVIYEILFIKKTRKAGWNS